MRMIKFISRLTALALVAGLLAAPLHAQTSVGTVEGTVTDEQGAILPGATATLTGTQGSQTAVTDERGLFRFVGVQPGIYTLKVDLGTTFTAQSKELTV